MMLTAQLFHLSIGNFVGYYCTLVQVVILPLYKVDTHPNSTVRTELLYQGNSKLHVEL